MPVSLLFSIGDSSAKPNLQLELVFKDVDLSLNNSPSVCTYMFCFLGKMCASCDSCCAGEPPTTSHALLMKVITRSEDLGLSLINDMLHAPYIYSPLGNPPCL